MVRRCIWWIYLAFDIILLQTILRLKFLVVVMGAFGCIIGLLKKGYNALLFQLNYSL